MKIEVYGKKNCPFCTKAKKLAEQLKGFRGDVDFKYTDYEEEGYTKETLSEKIDRVVSTAPQIVIDGKSIGGYTDFESYVKSNRLFSKK